MGTPSIRQTAAAQRVHSLAKGQEHRSSGGDKEKAGHSMGRVSQPRRGDVPLGSQCRAERPVGLCHTSPGPGGRTFLKGFRRDMGRRKEEKAAGSPLTTDVHAQFMNISAPFIYPCTIQLLGHRPKVDKYSHWAINEASAPPEPHPLGPSFPQPAGWAPCPAQLVSDFH